MPGHLIVSSCVSCVDLHNIQVVSPAPPSFRQSAAPVLLFHCQWSDRSCARASPVILTLLVPRTLSDGLLYPCNQLLCYRWCMSWLSLISSSSWSSYLCVFVLFYGEAIRRQSRDLPGPHTQHLILLSPVRKRASDKATGSFLSSPGPWTTIRKSGSVQHVIWFLCIGVFTIKLIQSEVHVSVIHFAFEFIWIIRSKEFAIKNTRSSRVIYKYKRT